MKKKMAYVIPLVLSLVGMTIPTISTTMIPIFATSEIPCSPPVEYPPDPRYLVERCSDGDYLIDRETGEKRFSGQNTEGTGKACTETETGLDFCIQTP